MIDVIYLATLTLATTLSGIALALSAASPGGLALESYPLFALALALLVIQERRQRPFTGDLTRQGLPVAWVRQLVSPLLLTLAGGYALGRMLVAAGVAYAQGDASQFVAALVMSVLVVASAALFGCMFMRQADLLNIGLLKAYRKRDPKLAQFPALQLQWCRPTLSAFLVSVAVMAPPMTSPISRMAMVLVALVAWDALMRRGLTKAGLPGVTWSIRLATFFPALLAGLVLRAVYGWAAGPETHLLTVLGGVGAAALVMLFTSTLSMVAVQFVPWFDQNAQYFKRDGASRP